MGMHFLGNNSKEDETDCMAKDLEGVLGNGDVSNSFKVG